MRVAVFASVLASLSAAASAQQPEPPAGSQEQSPAVPADEGVAAPPEPVPAPPEPVPAPPEPVPAPPEPVPGPPPVPAEPASAQPEALPGAVERPAPRTLHLVPRFQQAPPAERPLPTTLYARIAVGVGFPFGRDVTNDYRDRALSELRFDGTGLALDVALGTAVQPWLIIGGGAVSDFVLSGTVEQRDSGAQRPLGRSLYFLIVGVFADLYVAPPDGFHIQALLGFANLSSTAGLATDNASGVGFAFGIGYDWHVARDVSLGLLGRVALSSMGMDSVDGAQPEPRIVEPALLITCTIRPDL